MQVSFRRKGSITVLPASAVTPSILLNRLPSIHGVARPMAGSSKREYLTAPGSCLLAATPGKRPPYPHIIPLGQIIQTIEGASSPNTKKCQEIYSFLHQHVWE